MTKIIKYKYHIITFLSDVALIVLISRYLFGFEYCLAILFIFAIGVSEYCKGMERGIQIMHAYNKCMWENK